MEDEFARLLVVVAQPRTLNFLYFLSFPVAVNPMALALPDGTPVKTQKSKLFHKLKDSQEDKIDKALGINFAHHVYDGELLMHSVSSTATSDANFEATFCLSCVAVKTEANVSFDHYKAIFIKQCERELRGADDRVYIIRRQSLCNLETSRISFSKKQQLQRTD